MPLLYRQVEVSVFSAPRVNRSMQWCLLPFTQADAGARNCSAPGNHCVPLVNPCVESVQHCEEEEILSSILCSSSAMGFHWYFNPVKSGSKFTKCKLSYFAVFLCKQGGAVKCWLYCSCSLITANSASFGPCNLLFLQRNRLCFGH